MTLAAAVARGFARPTKTSTGSWIAHCPTCGWYAWPQRYKGKASDDAVAHNVEKHR